MQTRISKFAEGILEATWLAAIVMAPLFFNKYSSRIFEPDKATLIRSLALIALTAWILILIDKARQRKPINLRLFLKQPFVLPVVLLTAAYLIATIFSVTPRISFWGSYVRMQGFYTTISYIILFASIAANLRSKKQIQNLISLAILTSLPISLYGILQHAGRDPIPWGGDVTQRVASHMGNSIFVAAYLIMVVPLTIGRIVQSFKSILDEEQKLFAHVARATIYIFIGVLQVITIYYTGSRGPWLGFMASSFFLFVLLSLHWRKRWLTFSFIALAAIGAIGLILLNIPNGPLQSLREKPELRRLGQLIDMESRTAKVRVLIWQGASEMVLPHEPLKYPDGHKDPFNAIRPIIGYGPETMHMAYNPFYPPELAYVEKRNASPDRSHNETWDALVITGVLGLIGYLAVFSSVFYYSLKWLGFIPTSRKRLLFFILYIGGGVIGALGFILWQGKEFFGVGLPFGLIIGLTVYFAIMALTSKESEKSTVQDQDRFVLLIVLLSAVIAHFVEITFGIAIVSTRTYFWVYTALILILGVTLPAIDEVTDSAQAKDTNSQSSTRTRRVKSRRKSRGTSNHAFDWQAVFHGFIVSLLILPLNYEFISNLQGKTNGLEILWNSFTRVEKNTVSFGVLALIATAWIAANALFTAEHMIKSEKVLWWKHLLTLAATSIFVSLLNALWLSVTLAQLARSAPTNLEQVIQQTRSFEGLLTQYYIYLFLILIGIALSLFFRNKEKLVPSNSLTAFVTPLLILGVMWLISFTNLRIIHADIAFKMAEPFTNSNQWPVAIELYKRAQSLAPDEDYYYLFLGRAYLEQAKSIQDLNQKTQIFNQAQNDLKHAQNINPLNPDHTANLARLYSWWALQAEGKDEKISRGKISEQYYKSALLLSPKNARLYNELAILYLNILNQPEDAKEYLLKSIEIDPRFDWTHAILGDYYSMSANQSENQEEQYSLLENAAQEYRQAIDNATGKTLRSRQGLNYFFVLASTYNRMSEYQMAYDTLKEALQYTSKSNDIWQIEENLAQLALRQNNVESAITHLQQALLYAPDKEKARIQNSIQQLQQQSP